MKVIEKLYPNTSIGYSENKEYYIAPKDENGNNIFNGPIDLDAVALIEEKLKVYSTYYNECRKSNVEPNYTSFGITIEEANQYLDWIVYRSRESITRRGIIDANNYSFAGACNPTQQQVTAVMDKVIGCENVHPINTENIISHPDSKITKRQYSTAVRHCVTVVSLPIVDENNIVTYKDFLIDPTFKQFCLSENCKTEKYNLENEYTNKVAPDSAFFLAETQEGKKLAETLVYSGHTVFDEETAKLYGDAFSKASIGIEGLPFDEENYRAYNLDEVSKYRVERLDGEKYVFDLCDANVEYIKDGKGYLERFKSKSNEMRREASSVPQGYDMTLDDMKTKEESRFSNKLKSFFKRVIKNDKHVPQITPYKIPPAITQIANQEFYKTLVDAVTHSTQISENIDIETKDDIAQNKNGYYI